MPMLLLGHAVLFQHFHHAVGHAPGHVRHRAFGPLPGDRGTDAAFHPGQIDFGAMQVRAGGFKQDGLAAVRHHRVANIDVVFPVALIGSRGVADIRAGKQHQRAEIVRFHLRAQLLPGAPCAGGRNPRDIASPRRSGCKAPRIPLMRLADKSCIHNCGRNILSSIFDLRQSNNIEHRGPFCRGKVGQASACLVLTSWSPVRSQKQTG